MILKTAALAITIGLISLSQSGIANAATDSLVSASVSTTTDDSDVLWLVADIDEGLVGQVSMKIFKPQKDGTGRTLWQVCKFPYSGAGAYRCGMDVGEGSFAAKRGGLWAIKVFSNTEQLVRRTFSVQM